MSDNLSSSFLPWGLDRRRLLQTTVALLAGISLGRSALASAGNVISLRGEASAETAGQRRALSVGAGVDVGDLVSTGAESRLALDLGNRTTLRLGANTRIKIDRFMIGAGGDFELMDGVIMYEHKGSKPQPSQFRSPYGLIAVRGTRFYAGPSKGVFGVLVGSGQVEVTAGGQTVVVGPQYGTDIATPGAAPTAPGEWKYPRVKAMIDSVK